MYDHQTTIASRVSLAGIGVHSGKDVSVHFSPADADTGIVFHCLGEGEPVEIRALSSSVGSTDLSTVLGDPAGRHVATVEHLMATVIGLGIDNLSIEIDGSEVPILDGSAAMFVDAFEQAGIERLSARRRYIRIVKPVRVEHGGSWAEFRPHDGMRFEVDIDFDSPAIGRQSLAIELEPERFRRDVARARTFGFMKDVSKLWSAGYALGASLDNTLVVSDDRVLNPEGLRFADEFVRHKVLDAIGDLALAGLPLIGAYKTIRGGHKLNNAVLTALMANTAAWRVVEAPVERPRARGHAELAVGVPAAAFGPDVS